MADTAFLRDTELDIITNLSRLGALLYLMYRDDVLVILEGPSFVDGFHSVICNPSKIYKVELEKKSVEGVEMLDMFISKGRPFRGRCLLEWRAFVKATARHLPLGPDSSHTRSCHNSWPIAEMARLDARCSSAKESLIARQRKIEKFRRFWLEHHVVNRCVNWAPRPRNSVAATFWGEAARACRAKQNNAVRIVLPFSSKACKLTAALSKFHSEWQDYLSMSGCGFDLAFSFSRGDRALFQRVRTFPS